MKNSEVKTSNRNQEGGFITLIIFLIIALVLLKYFFNWSIFDASATPQGQATVSYTGQLINVIWSYLGPIVNWFWNNIFGPLFHQLFTIFLQVRTTSGN